MEPKKDHSLLKFVHQFKDEKKCLRYLISFRWPTQIVCPFCSHDKIYSLSDSRFKCAKNTCLKKFSPYINTVFENTKVPLPIWFYLIYSMAINKKNISSIQNGKNLGLTQKASWGMMTKLRSCLKENHIQRLSGIVEVDEVFCCKGNKWTRWGGISTRKAPVLGLMERGGKVVIRMIDNRSKDTLLHIIKEHVEPGSTIYTDGWAGYRSLIPLYNHDWVDHNTKEYVRGEVHTNTIENVWSMLKRCVRGTHHSVSEKYLEGYCNEVAFRFNYRDLSLSETFEEIFFRCINNYRNEKT